MSDRQIPWLHFKPEPPTTHNGLLADLAVYLRFHRQPFLVWTDIQFQSRGCVDVRRLQNNLAWEKKYRNESWLCMSDRKLDLKHFTFRPDIIAIRATFSKTIRPIVYEVKASRADFLSDVRSGKWKKYQRVAHQVIFAVPDNLIDKKEVPKGAGLIVRKKNHWRRTLPADQNDWYLDDAFWMTLLLRRRGRIIWEPA